MSLLTDDEINSVCSKTQTVIDGAPSLSINEFARAIEALMLSKLAAAEMPESEGKITYPARPYEDEWTSSQDAYSEDQLRAYGAACAARIQAENEALRKDAERYRYMRNNAQFQSRNGPGLYWYLPYEFRGLEAGPRLDAAIDAAKETP